MAVHPTKPQLLSASQDGSVKVWGLDTLTELCQILIPEESLSSFALVDPHHAICYSQKGVTMLNICTVSKSCLLSTHTHSVLSYVRSLCMYVSQTSNCNDTYVCLYVYLHIVCHNSIALLRIYIYILASLQPDSHLTALNSKVTSLKLSGSPGRLMAMCEVHTYIHMHKQSIDCCLVFKCYMYVYKAIFNHECLCSTLIMYS